jgi:serine/threonine protein kinase
MYGPAMDIWGAGCILFELTTLYPLFPGADEVDQINRIHRVLGTPSVTVLSKLQKHASTQANISFPPQQGIGLSKLLPDAKDACLDLLTTSVAYDATKRITSSNAIAHPYFVGAAKDAKENGPPEVFVRSSSVATDPVSSVDTTASEKDGNENKPVTKTRSMVSILLARVRFACLSFMLCFRSRFSP